MNVNKRTSNNTDEHFFPSRFFHSEMAHEAASLSPSRPYHFQLDVDIKRRDRICNSFGKTIYAAEWISQSGPPIVLVKIHGARAAREAAFYARLSCHPHIVRTFGFVESSDDCVMLVQERAIGDLSERLQDHRFRPSRAVLLEIFLQITEALIYLTDKQIVHSDLACRNVLICEHHEREPSRNLVKLTDFGLTRFSTVASTTSVIPIRYAAPEVIGDQPSFSEKSDVFSMGVLMWEALSRDQLPFKAISDDEEVRRRKLRGEILSKPDSCDPELWVVITQCWQQRTNDRPTFEALRRLLLKLRFQQILG